MHKTLKLAKVLKKGSGGENFSSLRTMMLIIGVIAILLLAALGVFMNRLGALIHDPILLFQEFFLMGAVVSLFFTAPMIINTMYMSNDLPVLLTLPYTYDEIIGAKLLNVSSFSWLSAAVFSIPCGLAYGIVNGAAASFYLALLLAAICIPIITISFIGSVIILIMYFVHSLRNKDSLKIIGAIFGFIILIAFVIASNFNRIDDSAVSQVVDTIGRFVNVIPINFALKVLLNGSFNGLMLLAAIGITAGFLLIFVVLTKFLYISGALSMQETSSSAMHLEGEAFAKACRRRNVFRTYLAKEFKLVRRNPAYLMRGFLIPYLYPAVILLLYIFSSNSISFLSISDLNSKMDVLGWVTAVSMLIASMASCGNVIAYTCISREGEDVQIMKQLPVDYREVLKAKQWTAMLISGSSCLLYVVIGGIIMVAVNVLPIWSIPYGIVISLAIMAFCTGMIMIPDLKKPLFTWESEADMIKNKTSATCIIILMLGIFVPLMLVFAIKILSEAYFWPVLIGMMVIAVLLMLLANWRLFRVGLEKMSKY